MSQSREVAMQLTPAPKAETKATPMCYKVSRVNVIDGSSNKLKNELPATVVTEDDAQSGSSDSTPDADFEITDTEEESSHTDTNVCGDSPVSQNADQSAVVSPLKAEAKTIVTREDPIAKSKDEAVVTEAVVTDAHGAVVTDTPGGGKESTDQSDKKRTHSNLQEGSPAESARSRAPLKRKKRHHHSTRHHARQEQAEDKSKQRGLVTLKSVEPKSKRRSRSSPPRTRDRRAAVADHSSFDGTVASQGAAQMHLNLQDDLVRRDVVNSNAASSSSRDPNQQVSLPASVGEGNFMAATWVVGRDCTPMALGDKLAAAAFVIVVLVGTSEFLTGTSES